MPGGNHSHLFEREAELRELRAVIQRARRSAGQTVLVEGPAGAGKSALVAAGAAPAAERGLRVLRASGSELERGFAFGVVRRLFEPVLAAAPESERERLLSGTAAPAGWVLGPPGDTESTRTRAEAGFAVLHALYWVASHLAARKPLLIVVDDLHWADEPSLRALSYLARRVGDLPIALLLALRPAEPGSPAELLDDLRTHPEALTLAPRPLSAASVAEIVRAQVPDADGEVCGAFCEASAGNPLYLRELLRTVAGDGEPAIATQTVRQASVPALGDRLARRIDRVAPEAGSLATAMAVLGDGGSLRVAGALAGMEADTAARIARGLARIEVLASEDPFTFVHPVIRRSVYGGLSVTELGAAHSRAADLLRDSRAAPETIAAHVSASAPGGYDAVAAALRSAAGEAMSRAAPDTAIVWLRRALDEGAGAPPRPVLLFELAQAEMAVRDPATIGHLQEALELAEEPELRGRIALTLAEILAHAGQWEAGLAVMARAKRELGEGNSELVTELEAFRAVAMAYDPRLVDEFECDRPRLTGLSAEDGWAGHALAALLAAATAVRCEGSAKVLGLVDRALAGGRLLGERSGGAWASAQILLALVAADEYERALEVADEVAGQGRRTGALLALLTGVGYRGQVHCRRGDLAAAEAVLRTALDLTAQTGMALWVVNAFHAFADAILERPQLADVAEKVDALELDPVFRTTAGGAMLLEIRGRLALARRDRERGLDDLRACAETAGALRLGPTYSPWRAEFALALPDGEGERAAELIAEELSLARASGLSRPLGVTLRYAGIHVGGAAGIELLRESEAKLATSPARLEHARSLVELGAALRRAQRRGEAREQLTAGMELAHRCGADRLVGRADDELHAAGGRPRRIARSGAEALTPSELRVALLATEGRSNVEIAQELFVSLKTVETHLSNAYAKLGLSGRGARGRLTEQLAATPS